MHFLSLISVLSFCFASLAQEVTAPQVEAAVATSTVEGRLLERGTKRPLADVNVFLLPQKLKATTDKEGRFSIDGASLGEAQLVINATGYFRFEKNIKVETTKLSTTLYLEKQTYQEFETTVTDRFQKRDDSTRTLKAKQFLTMPGANGDPVKAVQNLPGVARTGGGSQVIIQGSDPKDTSYVLDGHEVPLIFHFGGLTSVITPEAVEQVDYLSAGYGPEYGRAVGGIIGLQTRNPSTERWKGFGFVDTAKTGGLIEGPLSPTSALLVTARYSYLGYVLKAVLKDNSAFDLTVAPSFSDVASIYTNKIDDKNEFRLVVLGSRDELKFLFKEPLREDPSIRGEFSNVTQFYRILPQWTGKLDGGKVQRHSLGLGQDFIFVNAGENFFDLKTYVVTHRSELETPINERWKSFIGFDNQWGRALVNLQLPQITNAGGVRNPFTSQQTDRVNADVTNYNLGFYMRNVYREPESAWTLSPALRFDYFQSTREFVTQPRAAVRMDVSPYLAWKSAAGIYYQPPEPQEGSSEVGNPDIKSPWAWHVTTGIEKDFREGNSRGWILQPNLFYRNFENLVIPSSSFVTRNGQLVAERYNNNGKGKAYGLEVLVRAEYAPWAAWISYTLSRSTREEPGRSEYVFQYDQTHNLNLVGSVDLPSNWRISTRFRYVTGNPRTPIIGGRFDSDSDVYVPVRGPFYSERNSPFMQADLRIDKKWIRDTSIWSAYLDLQNVTNQKNMESVRYSYNYSETREVSGLPLIPTLGVMGEF